MSTFLKPFWDSIFFSSKINKKDFDEEVHFTNLYRYKIVCTIMVIYSFVALFFDHQFKLFWLSKNVYNQFVFLDTILVGGSLVFITLYYFKRSNLSLSISVYNKSLTYLIAGFILFWTAINSSIEQQAGVGYPSYILAVFVVGTIFYMGNLILFLFYLASYFVLIFSCRALYGYEFSELFARSSSVLIMLSAAYVISRVYYVLLYKNFAFKKLISETNENLDIMVRQRTIELSRTNRELQNKVLEYKHAQLELEKNRAQKRAILDNLPYLAWLKDINGKFISVNEAYIEASGRSIEDIIGKTDFDIWPINMANKYAEDDKQVIESKEKFFIEEEIAFKTGSLFCEVLKTPVFDHEGNVIGTTGIARNITLQKEIENRLRNAKNLAEQSDRLKTDFLANISHKLRTPMSSILGFSELIKSPDLPLEKKSKFADIINNRGQYMLQLVNDIIDISKIETHRLSINFDRCSLNQIFDNLNKRFLLEKAMDKRKEKLEIRFHKSLKDNECQIYADAIRLEQVISNLISNAIKYTNNGFVEISYSLKDSSYLQFHVKDTGIGIAKDKHNLIFERFKQVNSTNHVNEESSGLGLAISKGLVVLMGGLIWLDSTENEGTTFYFTIPYNPVPVLQQKTTKPIKEQLNLTGKKILVVEDDVTIFEFVSEILASTNAHLYHAENGIKAIEILESTDDIEMVLMDIQLPGITGYETTERIRKFNNHIPIIATTANSISEEKEKSILAGCTDYLSKPYEIKALLDIMKKHLII